MGEEQDSWFKQAFGLDLGQAVEAVETQAASVVGQVEEQVTQVVQQARAVVEPVIDAGVQGVSNAVQAVAEAVTSAVAPGQPGLFDQAMDGLQDLGGRIVEGVEEALATPGVLLADFSPAADPPPATPDASTAPDPTFVDLDRPFSVLADNPIEFVNKANEFLGQGAAGHMTTDTLTIANADQDPQGRVVRSNILVKTTTTRPSWRGGRTIGDEKQVILDAEALIQAHEERHRQIMKDGMTSAAAEIRGKPGSQADKILTRWIAKVEKDQDALDAREGKIIVIQSGGRITGVKLVPL